MRPAQARQANTATKSPAGCIQADHRIESVKTVKQFAKFFLNQAIYKIAQQDG
jgi:hypothetical protein